MKYHLTGRVTISISTVVEADSLEEAIKEAETRNIEVANYDPEEQQQEVWISSEFDGMPSHIEHDKI